MARRELQEINAGSMADIAFLLLIFFLVTTTMEVDAGIGRTLPFKRELPNPEDFPEIHERDVLNIWANNEDELLVEGEKIQIEDLEEIVVDFYTINIDGERDKDMPLYRTVTISKCQQNIQTIKEQLEKNEDDIVIKNELDKWETKLKLCEELPGKQYDEISPMSMIRLQNQSKTSYGLYIEIQDVLKKVVNDLRAEKCEEIWGKDYFALRKDDPEDQDIIKKLRILVPERIIEAKIKI